MPPHSEQSAARNSRQQSHTISSPIPIRPREMAYLPMTNGYHGDDHVEPQHLLTGMGVCNCGCHCTHCHCPDQVNEDEVMIDLDDYLTHEETYAHYREGIASSIETVNWYFRDLDQVRPESAAPMPEAFEDPNGIIHQQDDDEESIDDYPYPRYISPMADFERDLPEIPHYYDDEDDNGTMWSMEPDTPSTIPSSMYSSLHSNDLRRPSATPSMMLMNVGEVTKPRNNFLRLL